MNATPPLPPPAPDRLQLALANGCNPSPGDAISKGWALIKPNLWLFVGGTVVAFLGNMVPLIGGFVQMVILFGVALGARKVMRGEPLAFGDFFKVFDKFAPLLLCALVSRLLIMLGMILCVFPGIYLAVSWGMLIPLILIWDRDMEFWPAMELSRKIVGRSFWKFFWFAFVLALFNLAGILCCIVGVFFTLPVSLAACVIMFEEQIGWRR